MRNAIFHVQGLTGSLLGHQDIRGASVYGTVLGSRDERGESASFDFPSADLRPRARTLSRSLASQDLGWTILVEGHDWRAME